MKRPLKHVKWEEKKFPCTELQIVWEEACKRRTAHRDTCNGKSYAKSLKDNTRTSNHNYTINNTAEYQYNGWLDY